MLYYVGHVGSGFSEEALRRLHAAMQPLHTSECPFANRPRTNEKIQWIKPSLVCEVKFAEWTDEERLRQPIFLGLRDDKDPIDCSFEAPAPVETVETTS